MTIELPRELEEPVRSRVVRGDLQVLKGWWGRRWNGSSIKTSVERQELQKAAEEGLRDIERADYAEIRRAHDQKIWLTTCISDEAPGL
jgi:hypothetical protein